MAKLPILISLFGLGICLAVGGEAPPPQPQLVLPGRVVRVVDGDTLDVEVTLRVRVRLLDCWAPEVRTEQGKKAAQRMRELVKDGKCRLVVPLPADGELRRCFTFGRVLGRVYCGGQDVGRQLVREGLASSHK